MLPYPITADALTWDGRNTAHIKRHDVVPDEVEEVCNGRFVVLQGYAGRFIIVGLTLADRMLSVVLAPRYHQGYYVVTARPASRRERRLYRETM